jgi:hypothetical protein
VKRIDHSPKDGLLPELSGLLAFVRWKQNGFIARASILARVIVATVLQQRHSQSVRL